nr:hypothetical protein [Tanacetum cinerariifolium]
MACSVPHTDDEVEALVQKLIDEDMVRQKAILDLALQFDNACTAKDDLRNAYEKCNDIPQENRALINTLLKEESDKDYELNLSMYEKAAKKMNAKLVWLRKKIQLRLTNPSKLLKQRDILLGLDGVVMSTQEYMKKVVEDVGENEDFKSESRVSVTNYGNANGDTLSGCLGDIKNFLNNRKLDQVVIIVKSCSPNVIGNLTVTMKDLSGKIPETIHHKVVGESGYGKSITVGAALILFNVSVFSPKPSMHYLNITKRNMVKIFHKDTTPPSPDWSYGLFLISPAPSAVLSLISSPMISLTVSSPLSTATILVDEDQFIEIGAQLELFRGTLQDHTQRLDAMPPTLFTGINRDVRELYTRSGVAGHVDTWMANMSWAGYDDHRLVHDMLVQHAALQCELQEMRDRVTTLEHERDRKEH